MLRAKRALILFVLLALILSAIQPVSASPVAAPLAQSGGELAPPTPRPDAPHYGARGPYSVGVRDFVIDAPERRIPVTVWYPALNPEGAEESVTYTMDFMADPAAGFPTGGRALRDAEPDGSGGPYPLVLYSHGAWCFPAIAGFFTEHLASHGFVVMAPVHEDNWGTIFESTWRSEISRPQDMKRVLDFAEESTAPGGELDGLIDMENVAVTGQSFGGATALEMGGARLNLAEWQETFCVDFPEDEDCEAYPPHFEEMAALAGLDAVPEGLWPDWSDPRIDVVLATAPGVSMLGGGGLEGMNRPFMLLMGTGDNWVGPAHEYRQTYATLPGPDKSRVLFENADHTIFGNACPAYPGMVDAGFYFNCSDLVWDMNRAHDLTNHFAAAFLLAKLKGDADAAAALAPENVAFPGIQYETTGYGGAAEPESKLDDATAAKIEDLVEQAMAKSQVPGAAVGIVKDGQLVYAKGFGVTKVGGDQPVTPESVFYMASIAKTVTGMAIMQLVEEGKVDLDAPVTEYLPYFTLADPAAKEITIRQLLSHSSGMADYGDLMADFSARDKRVDDGALEDYVRSFSDGTLLFPPGMGWSYSNSGFDTLGDVIAKVSGQSYEDYVQEHILAPLGMEDSTFLLADVDPAVLVAPHTWNDDGTVVVQDFYPYLRKHGPSSTLFSTVRDMASFIIANRQIT
jgi:CubicO group peptidase (beta-lactamase class C family)